MFYLVNHVVYRIDFDNRAYVAIKQKKELVLKNKKSLSSISSYNMLSVIFIKNHKDDRSLNIIDINTLKLFPFSFGIDESLSLTFFGSAFEEIFVENQIGKQLYTVFNIIRPTMEVDWKTVKFYSAINYFYLIKKLSLFHFYF